MRKGVNEQAKMLVEILNTLENTAHTSIINSAFEQAGFSKYQLECDDDEMFYMKIDTNNAIRIRWYQTSPVVHGDDLKKRVKVHSIKNILSKNILWLILLVKYKIFYGNYI